MNKYWRFIPVVVFFVLAGFLFSGLGKDPTELPSVVLGKDLPSFELPTLDSNLEQSISNQALVGEAALINIWATWCATCLQEHPFLYELSQQGIKIVGVNYQDDTEKAKRWLKKYKNPYAVTVVDKKGRLGFDLGVTGAPETFLLDKHGKIIYRHTGVVDKTVWQEHFAAAFE
ncbi:DsbE family thiol:disulfide interchange protein [Agaribacterium sp. ZY112]|uniref:DsbE family thiol:disulfide interchange protein n=1 Tax=Agaribacterium sp. ZY112 TaxID=3233574 RepID=UPI00352601FD